MTTRLAIVGTGPTGIYCFAKLIEVADPLEIYLFERGDHAGIGMPYSPEMATKAMLANIASIEIPPLTQSYLDWLLSLSPRVLRGYGLDPEDLHERSFTPRLLLGEYYRAQLLQLIERARAKGHRIEVVEATEVTDLQIQATGISLETSGKAAPSQPFDHVILATGHDFPDADEATESYFPSPWSGLIDAEIPATTVGVMGTSLSSIDAVMAVANQHGTFRRGRGEELTFELEDPGLKMTMMSWTGIIPEADFYCPLPYEPLQILTEAAVKDLAAKGGGFDEAFALFKAELAAADPDYAARIGLDALDPEGFSEAYFADRAKSNPFLWARKNLDEVERNKAEKRTVAWRYTILRAHEVMEELYADLGDDDREVFDKTLKKVFVDNYGAIPSESIRRLLALRDAGVLDVLALGYDYEFETDKDTTVITPKGKRYEYDVFIDARGQRALTAENMPFPSLRAALLKSGAEVPEVDEFYRLTEAGGFTGKVSMGALPYLMHDQPFVQGITAAAEIGAAMAKDVRNEVSARRRRPSLAYQRPELHSRVKRGQAAETVVTGQ